MSQHKHSYINKGGLLVPPGENIVHRRQGLPLRNSSQNHVVGTFFFFLLFWNAPQYSFFASLILQKLLYWNLQSSLEHLKRYSLRKLRWGEQSVLWGIPK